jgi:hypothetical protein
MVFSSKFLDENFVLILVNFVLILYRADNQYPFLVIFAEKKCF